MRLGRKKDTNSLTPDQELEQKVDAMMDPRQTTAPPLKNTPKTTIKPAKIEVADVSDAPVEPIAGDKPEIDIFAAVKTAPVIPLSEKEKEAQSINVVDSEETAEDTLGTAADEIVDIPESDESEVDIQNEAIVSEAISHIADEPIKDPYDTPQIEEAITDITREDADQLLSVEDSKKQAQSEPKVPAKKDSVFTRLKKTLKKVWANKRFRRGVYIAIAVIIAALCIWPTTRYLMLNTAGVRSHASLKVVDRSTTMPLKNVTVSLGDVTAKTNGDGVASFKKIKLGTQNLVIDRVAFAPINQQVTIGWGSNPLSNIELKPVGARYTFNLTDYLSGKAVAEAEVVSGDASAFADASGQAVLTLDKPESDTIHATIKSKEYRAEKLSFAANTKSPFDIKMAPNQPIVYVSKQSGKYDLYKVDADNKNKQLLLAGTGSERNALSVSMSPDGKWAALVSSRSGKRDQNRYLLDTLTLINVSSGEAKQIDDAPSIRQVDWSGDRLIYVATYAAPSAGNTQRQRVVTYNVEDSARNVLVTSDHFNGLASVDGVIYYTIARSDPSQQAVFAKLKVDGSGKQTILDKETWTVVRTGVSSLHLETSEGWYEYKIGDNIARKGNAPVDTYANHTYIASPGSSRYAWIDNRDGKGVLLVKDQKNNDRTVATESGLTLPVRWLNKRTLAYRVQTNTEIADYVINIDGGEAKKISDVTETTGLAVNY